MSNFGYDKKAYTHGFEDIYALEKVDVKSIRKVAPQQAPLVQKSTLSHRVESEDNLPFQFSFSFLECDEKIKNFKLQEPLVVLQLSLQAEKRLVELGIKTLQDLYLLKQNGLVHLKNLGQGHIDEIEEKFFNYVGNYREKKSYIDFAALLKCTLADIDSKHVHLILSPHKLSHLFPITPAERMNVRHLQGAKKEEVLAKALLEVKKEEKISFVYKAFEEIFDVFVFRWMQRRYNIATQEEIFERILKKSQDPELAFHALKFFVETYFDHSFPLTKALLPLEKNLFSSSVELVKDYNQLVNTALTYFYSPTVTYPLEEFLVLLNKEFASRWLSFSLPLALKIFKQSSKFRVKKNSEGLVVIGLNFLDDLIVKNS
jgi:hypothetical protein